MAEARQVEVGKATEMGLVRRRNEDALLVDGSRRVFAVADGLGGHPAGDVASQLAIEVLDTTLQNVSDGRAPERVLVEALRAAHQALVADAWQEPSRRGMGTTAVVAHLPVSEREAWIAHVGDSRAYLLHEGQLNQLTRDHTTGGPFLRGRITQALGATGEISPDLAHIELQRGDRLLLCTDGLTDMVSEEDIERIAASVDDAQRACDQLVDAAIAGGGADNVTIIVLDV